MATQLHRDVIPPRTSHGGKAGTVTVSGKPGVEVPPGTLNSVLKQAGLRR